MLGKRHPLATYFGIVFGVSGGGGLALHVIVQAAGASWGAREAPALFPVLILSVAGLESPSRMRWTGRRDFATFGRE